MATRKEKYVTLPCDCKCCMFVVCKTVWNDGEINYNLSIMDSYYHNHNTIWGRIKRATQVLFGKPIYYNDAFICGNTYDKLVKDMVELKSFGS